MKILFPTDFSETSNGALELATSLARDFNATLIILFVEESPAFNADMYYGYAEPPAFEFDKMLAKVKPLDESVPYEQRMLHGVPANRIVDFAKDEGVDYIVMGTHGRTALTRLLMGSVAEEVVRRAPCPVVTFKPKQPVAAHVEN